MSDDQDYFAEIARNMRKIARSENRNLKDHAIDEKIQDEKTKQAAENMEGSKKAVQSPGVTVWETDNSAAPSPDKGLESSELVDPSKLAVQRHVGYIDPHTLRPAIDPQLVKKHIIEATMPLPHARLKIGSNEELR